MIQSFCCYETKELWLYGQCKRWISVQRVALRKLQMLNRASALQDLRIPPGNRLEALKGGRKGQHSIRINDQWRVCFRWSERGAEDVEIVDYH